MQALYSAKQKAGRALVVDCSEEFRRALGFLLRKLGFEVVGETGHYQNARDILQTRHCDLLITSLELYGDEAVELGGGVSLAYLMHSRIRGQVIFLSRGTETPDELEAAAACQPVAWIARTGTDMEPAERLALKSALTQYAHLREHQRALDAQQHLLDELCSAVLYIDTATGAVFDYSESLLTLLGLSGRRILDRQWWEVLPVTGESRDNNLAYLVAAGVSAPLPPMTVLDANGDEILLGGFIVPTGYRDRKALALMLQPLAGSEQSDFVSHVASDDVIAILGVSRLHLDAQWGVQDVPRFMMDLRAGLLEIVRQQDHVALPGAATICICLRDIDLDSASDIANALLSHLRDAPERHGMGASNAAITIGLAAAKNYSGALSCLCAANDALLSAQADDSQSPVHVASESDQALLLQSLLFARGALSASGSTGPYHQFLENLSALSGQYEKAADYERALSDLLLSQQGLSTVALYRRRFRDKFEFVSAYGAGTNGETVSLLETELSEMFQMERKKLKPAMLDHARVLREQEVQTTLYPLEFSESLVGFIALSARSATLPRHLQATLDHSALHQVVRQLAHYPQWRDTIEGEKPQTSPVARPVETNIDGYVGDNMEGAVDQAIFLARLDMPIAIVGARGTGKMYVARIIHGETSFAPDNLVSLDCRELRGRDQANTRIGRILEQGENKTIVFKSPHLLNSEVQQRLAKQLSTRTLADTRPRRYLPRAKYIALFPEPLDVLQRHRGLHPRLASVFAGYPITVPPIKDRKQAVLRWAHKILGQEGERAGRTMKGFTPDAEAALLQHDWPGNISEMRQCIIKALGSTEKEWITPVDLGLFKGIDPQSRGAGTDPLPFLAGFEASPEEGEDYQPTLLESLDLALGTAVTELAEADTVRPLGSWLDDELVLAACERYGGDSRRAAEFLQIASRNIGRWMPKINARQAERDRCPQWRESSRIIHEWVRSVPPPDESPIEQCRELLISHVASYAGDLSASTRARIMGVSTPTYQKRLQELLEG